MLLVLIALLAVASAVFALFGAQMAQRRRISGAVGDLGELASLQELVLQLSLELNAVKNEAEQARLRAISSQVNLQRALGPGGEVELVVMGQLRSAAGSSIASSITAGRRHLA